MVGLESWIRQPLVISGEARVVVIGADGSPSVCVFRRNVSLRCFRRFFSLKSPEFTGFLLV